jgi:hypothetical protein
LIGALLGGLVGGAAGAAGEMTYTNDASAVHTAPTVATEAVAPGKWVLKRSAWVFVPNDTLQSHDTTQTKLPH